jgi:HlyD family secretion protein
MKAQPGARRPDLFRGPENLRDQKLLLDKSAPCTSYRNDSTPLADLRQESELHMNRKLFVVVGVPVLLSIVVGYYFLSRGPEPSNLVLAPAVRRDLSVIVSTNGIIEPVDRREVYSPVDGFITQLLHREGSEIKRGQLLFRIEPQQLLTALTEAKAVLLQARAEEQAVLSGPTQQEVAEVEASIAEVSRQLDQQTSDLARESALLKKQAVTRESVEILERQIELLEVRLDGLKKRKEGLLRRYSDNDRQLQQNRVKELSRQVELMEQQVQAGSIAAPNDGILYSLPVSPGSYVSKGQLLGQLYQPGQVRLRAYIDEPDLGRVRKGQRTRIEWDGLPDRHWTGIVVQPARQVVTLGTRSVGYVLCSIDDQPSELIPNTTVKVQIVTASKSNALVVPRKAVFNQNGRPFVLVSDGEHTIQKTVQFGLVTLEEVEILQGIDEGNQVVTNPADVKNQ